MGFGDFLRGSGLWISKTLLVMCIMLSVVVYSGSFITSEAFLKPLIVSNIADQMNDAAMTEQYEGLLQVCRAQSSEIFTVPMDFIDSSLDINCTIIKTSNPAGAKIYILDSLTQKTFDSVYKKDVCSGSECFDIVKSLPSTIQSNPLGATAIISQDFHDYVNGKFVIFALLASVFAVLVFVLAKGWEKKFMTLGTSLLTSGLPYFAIPSMKKAIEANLPGSVDTLSSLITTLSRTFLAVFVTGVVLLLVGLGLKIYFKKKYGTKTELKKKK